MPQSPNRRPVQKLPPLVAERIAAGEVIERPASVVKELVENSLDAGATEVTVTLEDGGKTLIEILDNGHGMAPEDLTLSVERHATSKLRSIEDLESLVTLGFRGEALASVSAVSQVEIISRVADSDTAFWITAGGTDWLPTPPQAMTFGHFLGAPHGTRIRASGLFSQIPARLKFLKSQAAEVGQVREWLERLALARPDVSFRLLSDGRTLVNLRAQSEQERVRSILSDGEDFPVLTGESDTAFSEVRVRVHWLQGLSSPQMRKLVQVVNGRAVRDRMLQQAILSPFRQTLLPGKFPALAIFVEMDPSTLDVNVHPAKTEIRFLDSRKVFHSVQTVIANLIAHHGAPGFAAGPAQAPGITSAPWGAAEHFTSQSATQPHWTRSVPNQGWNFLSPPTVQESVQAPLLTPSSSHPFTADRFVGILFNTYLMYDLGSEHDQIGLIDQHAAHERVRYEALKKRALHSGTVARSQALLLPEAVHFAPELRETLESRLAWLEKLGFEAEIFGENSLLFRAIPAEWGMHSLRARLKNLLEQTLAAEISDDEKNTHSLAFDERIFEKLASEACHSAVRAGDRLETAEVHALVRELFACEHPWNCPHGRPTTVRVPRSRVEEWFQRRV